MSESSSAGNELSPLVWNFAVEKPQPTTCSVIQIDGSHGGVALDYTDMFVLDAWSTVLQGGTLVMLLLMFCVAGVGWGIVLRRGWRMVRVWGAVSRAAFIRDLAKEIAAVRATS